MFKLLTMVDFVSMGIKTRGFFRDHASNILGGFFVSLFCLSIIGPAIVYADVGMAPIAVLPTKTGSLPEAKQKTPAYVLRVEISAYTSRVEETDATPFITANGSRVRPGTLATNMLPFGTRVRIPALYGDKIFIVEDRMNARYQDHMDVWVDDIADARNIGRRNALVEVF